MQQPNWPFEYSVAGVSVREEFSNLDEDELPAGCAPSDVFLVEGSQPPVRVARRLVHNHPSLRRYSMNCEHEKMTLAENLLEEARSNLTSTHGRLLAHALTVWERMARVAARLEAEGTKRNVNELGELQSYAADLDRLYRHGLRGEAAGRQDARSAWSPLESGGAAMKVSELIAMLLSSSDPDMPVRGSRGRDSEVRVGRREALDAGGGSPPPARHRDAQGGRR